jgi:hypothetical protein
MVLNLTLRMQTPPKRAVAAGEWQEPEPELERQQELEQDEDEGGEEE